MQDLAERAVDTESLLGDGHKYINRNGDPALSFHSVLGSAIKCLDSKMLFDPFEEEFDLSTVFEEQRNCQYQNILTKTLFYINPIYIGSKALKVKSFSFPLSYGGNY